ncbi:hypothetical protein KO465_01330 [Candidatus Micrarchaeota archaeon]|nr:hypothetical protein [Candidatus Micrarchaeota archaeon]
MYVWDVEKIIVMQWEFENKEKHSKQERLDTGDEDMGTVVGDISNRHPSIVLSSCSTGRKNLLFFDNIAEKISLRVPGSVVYAPNGAFSILTAGYVLDPHTSNIKCPRWYFLNMISASIIVKKYNR